VRLSIVIPVYNTGRFLERCIHHLLCSEGMGKLFEIILVDDGSTDNSSEFISKILAEFPSLHCIVQQNLGLGAARNSGLAASKGEYIWFVDSDDIVIPGAAEQILDQLAKKNPDILTLETICSNEDGIEIKWIDCTFDFLNQPKLTGPDFFYRNYLHSYMFLYVIKRRILIENEIKFADRINMQDADLIPRVMLRSESVIHSSVCAYTYVKRSDSFTNSSDLLVRKNYFNSVLEVYSRLMQFRDECCHSNTTMGRAMARKLRSIERILFLSYVYEDFDIQNVQDNLSGLRDASVFPFRYRPHTDFTNVGRPLYTLCLVFMINFSPLGFRSLFNRVRKVRRS
jgi:glycosyltransferase involved in cell wall biosynthesis